MALNALSRSPYITPEEYIAGEKLSDLRHEYIDGKVYAMVGESREHNEIVVNMIVSLKRQLAGKPCKLYVEDVKVHIKNDLTDRFYYPDIQITCGPRSSSRYEVRDPKVIIEVLSSSTERKDRAEKFFTYRQLESLQEYVLVAQDTRRLEIFRRENNWQWELYTGEADEIELKAIDASLKLADLYEGVEFPESPPSSDQVKRD